MTPCQRAALGTEGEVGEAPLNVPGAAVGEARAAHLQRRASARRPTTFPSKKGRRREGVPAFPALRTESESKKPGYV